MGQEVRMVLNASKVSTETLVAERGDTPEGSHHACQGPDPDCKAQGIDCAII